MMKICNRRKVLLRRRRRPLFPYSHRRQSVVLLQLYRQLFLLLISTLMIGWNNNDNAFVVVVVTPIQSFELAPPRRRRRPPPRRRSSSITTATAPWSPRLGQQQQHVLVVAAAVARDKNSDPWPDDDDEIDSSRSSSSSSSSSAMGRRFGRAGRLLFNDDDPIKLDSSSSSWKDVWGVERRASHSFPFPLDVTTLAEQIVAAAWAAMVTGGGGRGGTNVGGASPAAVVPSFVVEASMDPNVVQNALYSDRMFGRRPVRNAVLDAGRIGIEIDGPPTTVNVMYVALRVAAHASLVQQMQQQQQQPQRQPQHPGSIIPVALYFASVQETLMARELLHRLRLRNNNNKNNNDPASSSIKSSSSLAAGLANVEILSLSTNNGRLPVTMTSHNNNNNNKKKRVATSARPETVLPAAIDPTKGIIFVVQPTDGGVGPLQRLAALATLEGLPVVLLSPRMTQDVATPYDQSGYQQSSAYGGMEPPTGPTPWLMRDFWPPVYSWIWRDDLAYLHSILHQKQSWDIFDCPTVRRRQRSDGDDEDDDEEEYCCNYLASTVNCAGRPTRDILRKIANEFRQHQPA